MSEANQKTGDGKVQWSLFPWEPAEVVVGVMEYGAKKYGVGNWRTNEPRDPQYFDAAMRHLVAWRAGETLDQDSGLNHLGHAISSLLILLDAGLPCAHEKCVLERGHSGPHTFGGGGTNVSV